MKTSFIEEMRAQLLAEKAKLETELSHFAHRNTNVADHFDADYPNLGDKEDENAAEVATFGDNLSLESELEDALKDIESAVKAIEAGTYGICKYCKAKITEDRLRARPTSTSCVACKKTLTQEV